MSSSQRVPDLLKAKKSLKMYLTRSGCANKVAAEARQEETMLQETEEVVVIAAKETTETAAMTEVRAVEVVAVAVGVVGTKVDKVGNRVR